MKSKGFVCLAMALVATLAVTLKMSAQDAWPAEVAKHHRYKVVDLGTFGGPCSTVTGFSHALTARGAVVGGADTPDANPNPGCANNAQGGTDCNVNHAFLWRKGTLTDLGTLPGGVNSFPQGANSNGWVVGQSENGLTDPVFGIRVPGGSVAKRSDRAPRQSGRQWKYCRGRERPWANCGDSRPMPCPIRRPCLALQLRPGPFFGRTAS